MIFLSQFYHSGPFVLAARSFDGFVLGTDRFGINFDTTFEAHADTLIEMVRRGYTNRMVLSQDASFPTCSNEASARNKIHTMLVGVPRALFEGR